MVFAKYFLHMQKYDIFLYPFEIAEETSACTRSPDNHIVK